MFYAQFVLSKKGPLAKVWLAAHWDKKLSKAQVYEANLQDAVNEIMQPKVKLALRTSGHLLLGIVRIHSRKEKYLLADCVETSLRMKTAIRCVQQSLVIDDSQSAPVSAITLPQGLADFDPMIPSFEETDGDMLRHMQINESRIEDITLKEDYQMNYNDVQMDDFGESALGGVRFDLEQELALISNNNELENPRDAPRLSLSDAREPTPLLEGPCAPGADMFEGDSILDNFSMDNFCGADIDMNNMQDFGNNADEIDFNIHENDNSREDELALGASVSPKGDIELLAVPQTVKRQKRKRYLKIDEQIKRSDEDLKSNIADYRDTLKEIDLSPPNKQLMLNEEFGRADKLFQMPASAMARSKDLVEVYQTFLTPSLLVDENNTSVDVFEELGLSKHIGNDEEMEEDEDNDKENQRTLSNEDMNKSMDDVDFFNLAPGSLHGADADYFGMTFDHENRNRLNPLFGQKSPTRVADERGEHQMDDMLHDEPLLDNVGALDNKESEQLDSSLAFLHSIKSTLRESEDRKITFSDLHRENPGCKTVAKNFYSLLVLKQLEAVEVAQTAPYRDIHITAGERFLDILVQ